MSEIRDINLKDSGNRKIDWAAAHMPVLASICSDFEKQRPFEGIKVALSVHLEAKTAYLACVFKAGGADVYATGSAAEIARKDWNVLSGTAAAHVFAQTGQRRRHCKKRPHHAEHDAV